MLKGLNITLTPNFWFKIKFFLIFKNKLFDP